MKIRSVHKLIVLSLMAMVAFVFGNASTVSSASIPAITATQQAVNPTPHPSKLEMAVGGDCTAKGWNDDDIYLPLNRWGDVDSFHTRLSTGTLGTGNLAQRIQKQGVASMFLSAGNIMWKGSAGITTLADRFCLSDSTFVEVDKMSGTLGNSMLNGDGNAPSVVGVMVTVGLIGALWAVSRGRDAKKKLTASLLGVGVLAMMVHGSTVTKNTGRFGFGSPGYMAHAINSVVSSMAAIPASSLNDSIGEINDTNTAAAGQPEHCYRYIDYLEDKYKKGYNHDGKLSGNAIVPFSLNQMWKTTGLRVFTDAQFGNRNPYGDKVNCRYLDVVSGIPTADAAGISADEATATNYGNSSEWGPSGGNGGAATAPVKAGAKVAGTNIYTDGQSYITGQLDPSYKPSDDLSKMAPFQLSSDRRTDAAMVAWAACTVHPDGTATGDGNWVGSSDNLGDQKSLDAACRNYFTNAKDGNSDGDIVGNFDMKEDHKKLTGGDFTVHNFMDNWEGTSNTAAVGEVMLYAVVSLVILVVFFGMALAVIGSKIGLLVMTLLLMLVVVASIFPSESSNNRIAQTLKQYVGMAVMAFGAGLMIAVVASMTAIIQNLGAGIINNSLISIIWAGISPAVSIFLLHYIFTKVFKAPSPFKPSAGMGFAKAAAGGAVGGAVGGGIVERQLNRARYSAQNRMAGAIPGMPGGRGRGGAAALSGGRNPMSGRVNTMSPTDGSRGATAAGGVEARMDPTKAGARRGLAEGADASPLVGEGLVTARTQPGSTSRERFREEREHQRQATEFGDEQRREVRVRRDAERVAAVGAASAAVVGGLRAAGGRTLSGARATVGGIRSVPGRAASARDSLSKAMVAQKNELLASGKPASNGRAIANITRTKARSLASQVNTGAMAAGAMARKAPGRAIANAKNNLANAHKSVRANGGYAKTAAAGALGAARSVQAAGTTTARTVRRSGEFVSRHKTALTMGALGAATVATGGIAAPLAAGYAVKKTAGATKRALTGTGDQRAHDMAEFNQHLRNQQDAQVRERNAAAKQEADAEAAEAKQKAKDANAAEAEQVRTERHEAQQQRDDEHRAEVEAEAVRSNQQRMPQVKAQPLDNAEPTVVLEAPATPAPQAQKVNPMRQRQKQEDES